MKKKKDPTSSFLSTQSDISAILACINLVCFSNYPLIFLRFNYDVIFHPRKQTCEGSFFLFLFLEFHSLQKFIHTYHHTLPELNITINPVHKSPEDSQSSSPMNPYAPAFYITEQAVGRPIKGDGSRFLHSRYSNSLAKEEKGRRSRMVSAPEIRLSALC